MEYHIVEELDREVLFQKLKTPKDLLIKPSLDKLLKYMLMDWLVVIACWLSLTIVNKTLYPIVALIIASRFHSFGVILHDLTHMPLKKKTIKIRIIEVFTGYPIATTLNAMRYHHLRHHKDSCMVNDPYLKPIPSSYSLALLVNVLKSSLLIPFWLIRSIYGVFAFCIPLLRQSYAIIFLQDKSGKNVTKSKEVAQCAKEDIFQFLFFTGVFTGVLYFLSLETLLLYYIVPALITGCFSGYRVFKEHRYTEPVNDRKMDTIIKTTTDHNLTGIARFFLAPRNIGCHTVHHLHPQVACYALPELRKWYLQNHPYTYEL